MGIFSAITGRDLSIDFDKIDEVSDALSNISEKTVGSAQESVRAAVKNLNEVAKNVGTVSESDIDAIFEEIGVSLKNVGNKLQDKAAAVKEFSSEKNVAKKFGSTVLMAGAKFGEGFLSIAEELGDGVVSICGWVSGNEEFKRNCEKFVKSNWSHDVFNVYYKSDLAKVSYFTEDSGAAVAFNVGGKIAGYMLASKLMAAAVPGVNAVAAKTVGKVNGAIASKGIPLVSKAFGSINTGARVVSNLATANTWGSTILGGLSGVGVGTEWGLHEGETLDKGGGAMLRGAAIGALVGGLSFGAGKYIEHLTNKSALDAAGKAVQHGDDLVRQATSGAGGTNATGQTLADAQAKLAAREGKTVVGKALRKIWNNTFGKASYQALQQAVTNAQTANATAATNLATAQAAQTAAQQYLAAAQGLNLWNTSTNAAVTAAAADYATKATAAGAVIALASPAPAAPQATNLAQKVLNGLKSTVTTPEGVSTIRTVVVPTINAAVEPDPTVPSAPSIKSPSVNTTAAEQFISGESTDPDSIDLDISIEPKTEEDTIDDSSTNTDDKTDNGSKGTGNGNKGTDNGTSNNYSGGGSQGGQPGTTPSSSNSGTQPSDTSNNNDTSNNDNSGGNDNIKPVQIAEYDESTPQENTPQANPSTPSGNDTPSTSTTVEPQPQPNQTITTESVSSEDKTWHTGGSYTGDNGYTPSTAETSDSSIVDIGTQAETETSSDSTLEEVMGETTTSVDNIVKGNKYTKIPTSSAPLKSATSEKSSGSTIIPIAAGLSAAAAAGIGAKAYIDRKNNNYNGDDDDELETDEWDEGASVNINYDDATEEEDSYLASSDAYENNQEEKYGARTSEELADIQ